MTHINFTISRVIKASKAIIGIIAVCVLFACENNDEKYAGYNKIGISYTHKYLLSRRMSIEELREIKQVLDVYYKGIDISNVDSVVCALDKNMGVLENKLIKEFIMQRMLLSMNLGDAGCKENLDWYVENIDSIESKSNLFMNVVATDNVEYFKVYLSKKTIKGMLEYYPELAVYAAHRKSCKILKLILDKVSINNLDDHRFREYAVHQCPTMK